MLDTFSPDKLGIINTFYDARLRASSHREKACEKEQRKTTNVKENFRFRFHLVWMGLDICVRIRFCTVWLDCETKMHGEIHFR